ncbi:MAG TPA: hypothetical protein VLC28_08070, partial [Flavitalea sp.]|nr:hypothetical protein [Flavitalea sp.]
PTSPDWAKGLVTGLRVKNDFDIDMEWNNGSLVAAKVHSKSGLDCAIVLPENYSIVGPGNRNIKVDQIDGTTGVFKTKAGETYIIRKVKS